MEVESRVCERWLYMECKVGIAGLTQSFNEILGGAGRAELSTVGGYLKSLCLIWETMATAMAGCYGQSAAHLRSSLRYKVFWAEVSGALGDLGTFIPIAIALTIVNGLDLGTTLIFTGAYNIATGLLFGVPMPVQPMKSIAAVAISESNPLSLTQIAAAGLCTAGILFILGITGLMAYVQRILPMPVVRGIQLIKQWGPPLVRARWHAVGNIEDIELDVETSQETERTESSWMRKVEALPTALMVFLAGVILAFIQKPSIWSSLTLGPSTPQVLVISWSDWKTGFVRGSIPQLPLSILNSVIAVCKLSADLFPDKLVSPTAVSTSVGVMNLVGCWFGAMPVCHGAGGLAGQCRFGATSGAAVVILGTAKIVVSLLVGSSLVEILSEFPIGLLGVLLLFSGVELAMACRDQNNRLDAFVMLVCTVATFGSNAALGFVCSIMIYVILKLRGVHYSLWWSMFRDTLLARSPQAPAEYQACPARPY
ncbi:hypothetical protein GOP47_0011387 [Adiantum capillus-veneris]|uniref:Molybdate transporter 1 n=1 Tax=Adiantum capillus-veneris TaxID=13818 RepID=A0A9D4ZFC5_ADICA|nr:hypothetical protein GOP47_0011387 [Adiantum capillus-veneris]